MSRDEAPGTLLNTQKCRGLGRRVNLTHLQGVAELGDDELV